jgi:hypothetical protein
MLVVTDVPSAKQRALCSCMHAATTRHHTLVPPLRATPLPRAQALLQCTPQQVSQLAQLHAQLAAAMQGAANRRRQISGMLANMLESGAASSGPPGSAAAAGGSTLQQLMEAHSRQSYCSKLLQQTLQLEACATRDLLHGVLTRVRCTVCCVLCAV